MKKKIWIMAALLSAAFLLISCRKEEEPTLIDDQEIFGSSETAAATEVSESGSPSESTETPNEPKPPRVIPVPKGLASDPAVLEFAYYDWYLNDEHAFAAEDDRIYYARKRTMIPTVSAPEVSGVFLYCVDKTSGDVRLCCSNPACEHNTGNCGAFLCANRIRSLFAEDGLVWYFWDKTMDSTETHIGCLDTDTEKRLAPWKIEHSLIIGKSKPMNTDCFFLNGYVIIVQSSAVWNRAEFGEFTGVQGYTDHAIISAWKLPDSVNTSGQENSLILAEEILDETYEDMYRQRVLVRPYGDYLYILQSGEKFDNPDGSAEPKTLTYSYTLSRWRPGEEPEILLESDAFSAWQFWAADSGEIYLLEFEDPEDILLVRADPEKKTEEILAVGDQWWRKAKFTEDRIIAFEEEEDGITPKNRMQVCRVYDFSGILIEEYEKTVVDPRNVRPDSAPGIYTVRYTADRDGVYLGWKEGVMYYPFDEEEPVRAYGYEQ